MNLIDTLKIAGQYCLPQHLVSRLVGKLAAAEAGQLTTTLIRHFITRFGIDMSEAEFEEPSHYRTFNAFFTRALKPGLRPVVADPLTLALPVDGAISQLGDIREGRIIQAKGHDFSARELLGGDTALAAPFQGGKFATIYLSPKDYHRIHMPLDGVLESMIYIPGDLFSVNPLTAAHVPNLFARNERVACIFRTEIGPVALVLVGATIVASIETVWAGTVTPPVGKQVVRTDYQEGSPLTLQKGMEMGRFKLGSTVVCLFPAESIHFVEGLTAGSETRMGAPFAQIRQA